MSKHWIETALEIANEEYYLNHLAEEMKKNRVPDEGSIPIIKVGDTANCAFCPEENITINYVYGGKPMCRSCAKEILN